MELRNVKLWKSGLPKLWIAIQVLFVAAWMLLLWGADELAYSVDEVAYPLVYSFCGIFSMVCMGDNFCTGRQQSLRVRRALFIIAMCFSMAVCLANYPLFEPARSIVSLARFAALMVGGTTVFWHILHCAANRFPHQMGAAERKHPTRFFLSCFVLSSIVYLSYLFCEAFPGYYMGDMVLGFQDIVDGAYDRIIPVWHTLFIELCLNIGYVFGWEGNAALAVYTVIQAVAFAATCSYALVTLYEIGIPKWGIAVCFFVYTLFPYNIIYSVKIWKDIPFGIGSLAMAVAMYRVVQ